MKKRNDDLRLECVNWDEEQPATIKSKGRNHAVSRKVAAFLAGMVVGIVVGGCSVFGPGIGASVY